MAVKRGTKRYVGVHLPIPLYDKVTKLADEKDRSLSYIIRELLEKAVKEIERKRKRP